MDWAEHTRRIVDRIGESVTYTPFGGSAGTVQGIFSNPYFETGGDVPVEGSAPTLFCMSADIPNVKHLDIVVRGGITYTVVGVEPDGKGAVLLRLRK